MIWFKSSKCHFTLFFLQSFLNFLLDSFHTVGVIIKVNKNSVKVLTQNGDVRTLEPHLITSKLDSKRAIATDANGNSITAGATVMEARGERRTCTILHVYRHLVFLHSRENMVDYGVWISPTRSVISVAAKERPNVSSKINHAL